jgi:hypothetical protein
MDLQKHDTDYPNSTRFASQTSHLPTATTSGTTYTQMRVVNAMILPHVTRNPSYLFLMPFKPQDIIIRILSNSKPLIIEPKSILKRALASTDRG